VALAESEVPQVPLVLAEPELVVPVVLELWVMAALVVMADQGGVQQ
jgi:hypothetical protein